ncbi:unnamed protein product [Allacma fusca]|uniref:DUF4806 domain-containing protein n=1 Tax=Allacma fusca TaxID=39272 RepID=A0A8J2J6X3_9HEXA|nr:unnamed protein product [Allacma fusca]
MFTLGPLNPEASAGTEESIGVQCSQETYDSINEFSQQIAVPHCSYQSFAAPRTTCAPQARTLKPDVSMRDFYEEFQRFQEVIVKELSEIKADVEIIKLNVTKQSRAQTQRCPIELPIKSDEELTAAESIVKTSSSGAQMYNWCAVIGGLNANHHGRRVLSRIFEHEYSIRGINLTGVSKKGANKTAFKNLELAKILIGAIADTHNVSEAEVEINCGIWFRGAGDRKGGRSKRVQQ